MAKWLLQSRSWGFLAQSVLLVVVVLVAYALIAPLAAFLGGRAGLLAAGVAAGICAAGACMALAVAHLFRQPNLAWQGWFWGTIPRLGIPLGAAIVILFCNKVLAEAGVLYYLVGFYQLTLLLETALTLPASPANCRPSAGNRPAGATNGEPSTVGGQASGASVPCSNHPEPPVP